LRNRWASGVEGDDTESFEYDALNRLTEAQDDDSTAQMTYDSLSQMLTEVQGANPPRAREETPRERRTCPGVPPIVSRGRRDSGESSSPRGAIGVPSGRGVRHARCDAFARSPAPRGVSSRALRTEAKTVTYTPDLEGNVTEVAYPSSFSAVRTIDDDGRVSAIEDGSSNDIVSWAFYGGGHRTKTATFGNTTTATYSWDGFRRPTSISHKDSSPTGSAAPRPVSGGRGRACLRSSRAGDATPTSRRDWAGRA
jgi:YD repeat-containing protein